MDRAQTRRFLLLGTDLYLAFTALAIVAYGFLLHRWSSAWILSDWLINYEGGFVRRGLAGEVFLRMGHLFHIAPKQLVVPVVLAMYAVLLLAFRSILHRVSWHSWVPFVVFCPAILAFPVLQSEAGFHKEVFFLAAFALFLVLLRKGVLSPLATGLYLAVTLSAATLSHESLALYAPYFFAALALSGRSLTQSARQCAVPFAVCAVAVYFCGRYTGTLDTAQHICASLGYPMHLQYNGTEVCDGGAIPYLRSTRAMALAQVRSAVVQYHYFTVYGIVALLTVLPLLAGALQLARTRFRREVWVLAGTIAVSGTATLILFTYAIDWGRWIYIHAFCIGLLLLFLAGREYMEQTEQTVARQHVRIAPRRLLAAGMLLAVYATVWTLPEFYTTNYRYGYVGLVRFVFFHKHSIRNAPTGTQTPAGLPAQSRGE